MKKESSCGNCKVKFQYDDTQKAGRWCSNQCQMDHQYKSYISSWKLGEKSGVSGKYDVSNHIRRYLFEVHNSRCSKCGWGKVNQVTGKVPLHIDHINGDSSDNCQENLRLICPNCHSLTANFGILNKGKGRYSRNGVGHPRHKMVL